jgi:hypothetical protein
VTASAKGAPLGPTQKQVSPFAPRKNAAFAERKATIRQILIRRSLAPVATPVVWREHCPPVIGSTHRPRRLSAIPGRRTTDEANRKDEEEDNRTREP